MSHCHPPHPPIAFFRGEKANPAAGGTLSPKGSIALSPDPHGSFAAGSPIPGGFFFSGVAMERRIYRAGNPSRLEAWLSSAVILACLAMLVVEVLV